MALTDLQCKSAKPKPDGKPLKLFDGLGLFLHVTAKAKTWRLKYYFHNFENLATIGQYPQVTLTQARKERDRLKELIGQGIDPNQAKKQNKAEQQAQAKALAEKVTAYTFENAFFDWFNFKSSEWTDKHASGLLARFKNYMQPLASMPLDDITAADCIAMLKTIESQGKLTTMAKARIQLGQIMRYAVSTGKLASSPERDISNDIFTKTPKSHFAHQTDPKIIQGIYQTISLPYSGHPTIHNALKLLALTFLRANELAGLKWCEVDLDKRLLRIEADRMKMKRAHLVPLSKQAVEVLEQQKAFYAGGDYVFSSWRNPRGHITTQSLLVALRKQGVKDEDFTNHGWRHAASTVLHELGFNSDWVEMQLAHVITGVRGVYNKSQHLPERAGMMQAWADFLTEKVKE